MPQAFATLQTRYSTTKLPDDLNAEAVALLQPKWPSKLDPIEFQAMVSDKIRVAQKLGFDVSDATRAIWWPVISTPPKGHPMHAAAEMAHARTNGEHATVAHRTKFIEVMLVRSSLCSLIVLGLRTQIGAGRPRLLEDALDVVAGQHPQGCPLGQLRTELVL